MTLFSEPSAAAQLQKQLLRDASTESASKRGICFSPTAVITAATLLTLVFVAVIFVLLKSRKTVHQFY
ncbi:hypothetical protein AAVH_16800 [Aphelenchoides avenae]|nr:hypothetical protein AAVH_16800 [Aphelenchus avenae]